jgi:DNA-binding beta-propeller fold protein YncE
MKRALGVLLALGALPLAAAAPKYKLARHLAVGGEGGWDYVFCDSDARRVYVSHATHVVVLDADSGKVVGDIPETEGVHGIAIAPELKRGFTSNGRSSTVSVFDLATLKVTSRVKTSGENPDAILYEPFTKRVFTFNGRSANATVIDAESLAILGTIPLGGKPEFARSDGKGRVYVNIEDKNELAVLDPKALSVLGRHPVAPCDEPGGLAIDAAKDRLFVGCGNALLLVVSASDGKVLQTLPIGHGNDAVARDEGNGLILASNGEGTLTVIGAKDGGEYEVLQTVQTEKSARTVAVDTKTHAAFLPSARFGPPPSPTTEQPRPRPPMVPGSFEVLVVAPE